VGLQAHHPTAFCNTEKVQCVLDNCQLFEFVAGDCSELLAEMPGRSVDLVFTSPPYERQRTYESGMPGRRKFALAGQAWVDWLGPIIVECCRVSQGLVIVNMSSPVKAHSYSASVEWLVADLTRIWGLVCGPSPYCWRKRAGIPGSGQRHYHRRDWEPLYAFCLPDRLPLVWSDQLAFGKPPTHAPGGVFSHRDKKGQRHTYRRRHGGMEIQTYTPPAIANSGNVIATTVGGGHLGSKSAHKGEAPMPEALAERFIAWYCPPSGVVLDPFLGTGTTAAAAIKHNRRCIGFDIRQSQIEIATQRMREVQPALI
jgi:hypothetical protein